MLEIGIFCAIVAYVWSEVLIKPDQLFGPLWGWVVKLLTWETVKTEIVKNPDEIVLISGNEYREKITTITKKSWFIKPLGGCVLCFAGQLALWSSIICNFEPIKIIIIVCISIITAKALTKILS